MLQPGCFYSCATATINMEQFHIYSNRSICDIFVLCNYYATIAQLTCDRATVNALDKSSVFAQFSRQLTLDKRGSRLRCVYGSAGRFPTYLQQWGSSRALAGFNLVASVTGNVFARRLIIPHCSLLVVDYIV